MRLAVLLHMFNKDLLQELYSYINNITLAGYKYDIYVAIPYDYEDQIITELWPEAHIIHHENRGFDIASFFSLYSYIVSKKYDFVLKLHTKSQAKWRHSIIDPILGTPEKVKEALSLFDKKSVGMVGSKEWMISMSSDWGIYSVHIKKICERWNIMLPPKTIFFGGTIFWIRHRILRDALARVDIPSLIATFNTLETLDWVWYLLHYEDLRRGGITTESQAVDHWNNNGKREGRACNVLYGRKHNIPIHIDGMIEHSYERFFGVLVGDSKHQVIGI